MITIQETRTLTLYLVDSDGQPVRAADDLDLDRAGFVPVADRAALTEECDALRTRIADLESRAERAESLAPLVVHWRARAEALESERDGLKVDRDALAALHADLGEQVDSAWKALGNPPVRGLTTLADVIQVRSEDLKERIAEFESTPLHPAVVRVVEAARAVMARDCVDTMLALSRSLDALPCQLPRVVTCGECARSVWFENEQRRWCKKHERNTDCDGFCHLGVAR